MSARIAGFISRAAAGLRAPRSVSRNINPAAGGVAFHYGGPAQNLSNHSDCIIRWRNWQIFHMNKGWSDIAYTGGVCQHGYAFAGRGAGVRTAANGTNDGNNRFYAICWLGGEGEQPTRAALDAYDWWVQELRDKGKAGREVRAHRYFKSTGCPGNYLVAHAAVLHNADIGTTTILSGGGRMIIRFDGTNEVWEVVGSHLEYISGQAFFARSLSHSKVVVLEPNHPLNGLPKVKP